MKKVYLAAIGVIASFGLAVSASPAAGMSKRPTQPVQGTDAIAPSELEALSVKRVTANTALDKATPANLPEAFARMDDLNVFFFGARDAYNAKNRAAFDRHKVGVLAAYADVCRLTSGC